MDPSTSSIGWRTFSFDNLLFPRYPLFTCELSCYFYGHTHSCQIEHLFLNWYKIFIKIVYNGVNHMNILLNWKTKIMQTFLTHFLS